MKLKVVLVVLVAALLFCSAATAYYILPFGKGRQYSKIWVREACEARGPSCYTWKVQKCARIYAERVDCAAFIVFKGGEYCNFVVENRVMGNGYVHQRRRHLRCDHV